ncbi:MAG: hypothetical protein WC707_03030 [Candidatus Babeliaceae bacterium]|jgi:hypothetical protein
MKRTFFLRVGAVCFFSYNITTYTGLDVPQQQDNLSAVAIAPTDGALQWERQSQLLEDEGVTTTVSDQRGNWYFKRQILKEAGPLHEAIREKVDHATQAFKKVVAQRTDLDKNINSFLHELRLSDNLIASRIAEYVDKIVQLESKKDILIEQKKELDSYKELKKILEDLQADIAFIQELDVSLDKALSIASEQMDLCTSFGQKAWNNYDEIAEVLNDALAEKLFFEMQGHNNNIDAIILYITRDFSQYLSSIEKIVAEYKEKISQSVKALSDKGVLIIIETQEEQAKKQEAASTGKIAPQEPVAQKYSWWATFVTYITIPFHKIYEAIMYVWGLFKK